MSQQLEIYTYCSMNKQYVEGVQKWKKANLMRVNNITMWLYHSLVGSETTSLLLKKKRQKEVGRVSVTYKLSKEDYFLYYCNIKYLSD